MKKFISLSMIFLSGFLSASVNDDLSTQEVAMTKCSKTASDDYLSTKEQRKKCTIECPTKEEKRECSKPCDRKDSASKRRMGAAKKVTGGETVQNIEVETPLKSSAQRVKEGISH